MLIPKQIKIENKKDLKIVFNDNQEIIISLKYLRDECPCAGCKGETILLRTYRPAKIPVAHPEMYNVKNIKTVGGYAIQIEWKDGHSTGIYSWEYLLQLSNDQNENKSQDYDRLI